MLTRLLLTIWNSNFQLRLQFCYFALRFLLGRGQRVRSIIVQELHASHKTNEPRSGKSDATADADVYCQVQNV